MRSSFLTLSFALVAWMLPGCSSGHDGRLLVVVSTDLSVPTQLARVEVSTGVATESFAPPLPFSFVIAAQAGREPGAEVEITARGIAPDGSTIVERVLRTSFVPNQTLIVPVVLARICSTVGCTTPPPCPEGSVCSDRGCTALRVEGLREARSPGEELEPAPDAGAPVGLVPIPVGNFCDELAALQCDALFNCCPDYIAISPAERASYRAACIEEILPGCRTDLEPIFSDPRTGYDSMRAAAVMAEGRQYIDPLTCSLALIDWYGSAETGLFSVLRGTVLLGGDCTPASPTDLPALFSCSAGACTSSGSRVFTCSARACYEQECVGELACEDGLYCTSRLILTPGQCAPRRPVGEPCTADGQCESLICAPDTATPRVCRPRTARELFCPMPQMGM